MKHILLIIIPLLISCCLSLGLTREEYCQKTWRWDLECALNFTLSNEEIAKVKELAESLRGKDCVESSWNVLEWIEKNIEYDSWKALLPSPTILTKGKEVEILNPERYYQTPIETVGLRKGICGDYAILTTALLMNLDCNPHPIRFEFEGETTEHLATAVFLDQYYVLDQTLPPMDLGSYYKKWLREGKRINMSYVYDRGVQIEKISPDEMKKFDFKFSDSDLKFLEDQLRDRLRQRMKEDPKIPSGYWKLANLRITFQNYAELYTPVFKEKIAKMIADEVIESLSDKDENWRAFKVEVVQKSSDLIVDLQLAK